MDLVKLVALQEKVEETIPGDTERNLVKVRKINSCKSGQILSISNN